MVEPKSVFSLPRYKRVEFEEEDSTRVKYSPDAIGFGNPNAASIHIMTPSSSSSRLNMSDNVVMPDKMLAISDAGELTGSQRVAFDTVTSEAGAGVNSPGSSKYNVGKSTVIINKGRVRIRTFWDRASSMEKFFFLLIITLAILSILQLVALVKSYHSSKLNNSSNSEICLTKECVSVASSILNSLNSKVNPCHDFYNFACGGWMEQNPLPDGKSAWGPFQKLWQNNQLVIKNVLDEDFYNQSKAENKARTFYRSCLDKNGTIEKLGAKPMLNVLKDIGGWNISGKFSVSNWNLQEAIEKVQNEYKQDALFVWIVDADLKNSSVNIIQLEQGGLTLPGRDYYINKTLSEDPILQALKQFIVKICILLGANEKEVIKQAEDIIQFETRLAQIMISTEARIDEFKAYHKVNFTELQQIIPAINWKSFFSKPFNQVNYTIEDNEIIGLFSAEYFKQLSTLLVDYNSTDEKRSILANYLGWVTVPSLTSRLPKPFRDAYVVLEKALEGTENLDPIWRVCVGDTERVLGYPLGAMFVKSVFKGESKQTAETMIEQVRQAFEENLVNLEWMDSETKKRAKEKADAIAKMIGFPDYILNPDILDEKYNGLEFEEDAYFENSLKVMRFHFIKSIENINKPVNHAEWDTNPSAVNAFYLPVKDTMVFPAGILQQPFYDVAYPKSVNFGSIGMVMGHELTHAFDNRGRKYDKYGNLNEWWDNETISNFEKQIKCFADQYSKFKVGDEFVNGERTLSENIADNGGLKAALNAYKSWAMENSPESALPGLNYTSVQIFFIRFAQFWCYSATPEQLKIDVLTDSHSPRQFRVIGTLRNSKEFSEAFSCPINSPMNPDHKCEVW